MNKKKLVLAALTVTLLSSGAVFAQGKGNGAERGGHAAENGNSNGNGNGNGNGAIASELKWGNAAHASEQAFLNAAPNSAVGMLATMREAVESATEGAADAYAAAGVNPEDPLRDPALIQGDIDAISGTGGSIEAVESDIAALDPASATYEADLAALAEELAALEADAAQLEAELAIPAALEEAEAAVAQAEADAGFENLSEEALAALWEMLSE